MEIAIDNSVIFERIKNLLEEYYANNQISESIYSQYSAIRASDEINHNVVIQFCIDTNTSYQYVILGNYPIYDVDNTNRFYKKLIEKGDYTI